MARSKLPEDTVIRLVQCPRWGVCDAGPPTCVPWISKQCIAFSVSRPIVLGPIIARWCARWTCRRPMGCAAHSTLRLRQVAWIHTALAMGSWFLLWVDVGPRPQESAATLVAQVVARVRAIPLSAPMAGSL